MIQGWAPEGPPGSSGSAAPTSEFLTDLEPCQAGSGCGPGFQSPVWSICLGFQASGVLLSASFWVRLLLVRRVFHTMNLP